MIKKILSFVLVITVIFALGACGKSKDGSLGVKVGVIMGPEELFPETAEAVKALAAKYGEDIVKAGFPSDYANDSGKAIESIAKALVLESKVQAVVFANAVTGTANAIDKIKEIAPKVPVICCCTDEEVSSLTKADAVINPDTAAMGKLAVEKAKAAGAVNFYYYSFQRNEGYENNIALRKAVEDGCKEQGITFTYVNSVDPISENGAAGAGMFIIEDAARNELKKAEGQTDAYLSTDPAVFSSIVKSAVRFKNVLVPQGHGSSVSGLSAGLEIDMTGNEGNADYVLGKAPELLKDITGKASVPAVSLPTLIVDTAVVCAAKAASSSKTALDEATLLKAAQQFADQEKFTLTKAGEGKVFKVSASVIEF